MESGEQEDDLGNYCVPIDTPDADARSQLLGRQRGDFNISPPTIPRSDTANIFSGSAFTSTSVHSNSYSGSSVRNFPPQHFMQGQIPSYAQEGERSAFSDVSLSNLRWQSSIVPQARYEGADRNWFTPLHSRSNEESKFTSFTNPISPSGVTSPGFGSNFVPSPMYNGMDNTSSRVLSPTPITSETVHRSASATASLNSVDPATRQQHPNTRSIRTPIPQEMIKKDGETSSAISPPPQNLRGDPFRSAKVKTELCRHYNTPKGCPFGEKCNYAHGDHELKLTKLMDLERAGLIDVEIFRTHPCQTWVATGACPFDQRCVGIHDLRVEGDPSNPSWLPHAETLISKVGNGNNVDKFYHAQLSSIYNSCPVYGYIPMHKSSPTENENESIWCNFYNFICNEEHHRTAASFDPNKHILQDLSEEHKLEIALKMRQQKSVQSYAYIPSHLFCGELCMILQERTFRLVSVIDSEKNWFSTALEEVASNDSTPLGSLQFKAYEIVFGPVGDPTVPSPSVWFDIPEDDLTPCTPQQAKHHKRSRHRIKKLPNRTNLVLSDSSIREKFKTIRISPFLIFQPLDYVTFDIITKVMVHRLKVIKLSSGKFDNSLYEAGPLLESERNELKQKYLCLLRSWIIDSWPEKILTEPIDDETDVPPVDCKYSSFVEKAKFFRTEQCYGLSSKRHLHDLPLNCKFYPSILWKSFTVNMLLLKNHDIGYIRQETSTDYDDLFNKLRRLSILRSLSMGKQISNDRCLSHIRPSLGVGPSGIQQSIETVLEQWAEIKTYYEENTNTDNPLRRLSNTAQVLQSSNGRTENVALENHLMFSLRRRHRIVF